MNVRRISWGLIVLFVGLILLFSNLGYISFNWLAVFSLWPVLLILLGLSFMLPEKQESKYLMAIATIVVLILFLYQGIKTSGTIADWMFNQRSERKSNSNNLNRNTNFSQDLDSTIKYATLNIEGGAIAYRIGKSTKKLFLAQTSSNSSNFSLSDRRKEDKVTLDFKMRNQKGIKFNRRDIHNIAEINLSVHPIWEINLEIGAGTANFDLSDYKIKELNIDGGASGVQVRMGIPIEKETKINLEGGLASFELSIPKESACRIVSDSALSSGDFAGFIKQEDGSFTTENYNNSEKRFAIKIDSGLSSFNIKRY